MFLSEKCPELSLVFIMLGILFPTEMLYLPFPPGWLTSLAFPHPCFASSQGDNSRVD